jgi:hypothetical protein
MSNIITDYNEIDVYILQEGQYDKELLFIGLPLLEFSIRNEYENLTVSVTHIILFNSMCMDILINSEFIKAV